jgi:Cupin-like domain
MEWYLSFYQFKDANGVTPLECTVRAGEVIFVPRGWWHAVLNLEESVAVTQNYVSAANLDHVLTFLKSPYANALVSGVNSEEERVTLHDRFLAALRKERPEVIEKLLLEREEKKKKYEVRVVFKNYYCSFIRSCRYIELRRGGRIKKTEANLGREYSWRLVF